MAPTSLQVLPLAVSIRSQYSLSDLPEGMKNLPQFLHCLYSTFPFMGIRFIAINDNYDSNDYIGGIADIDVQFKSLLYDFYSKDLSDKIITALDARKDNGTFYTKGEPLWTDYKVSSILNNEMYTGTFVYGKYRVKAVGSKQKQLLPASEWKRIPNHHEAIISMEEYEQVQSMKGTVPALFTPIARRASVYTGRVICDCCGRNMVYKKDRVGKMLFQCNVNYRKKYNCTHRILVTDLDTIIKGELSRHISGLAKLKILLDKEKEQQNERIRGAKQRLNMAEDTLRRLELELRTAYESYAKGITDKETYLMQKESYEVMISGIKEKIEAQKEAVFVLENQKPSDNIGLKFLEDNSEVAEITDELLDALLERIVVYADKTIELRWKFSNRSN